MMEEASSQSNPNEVLGNTQRGSGGFGSTDIKSTNTEFTLKERTTVERFLGVRDTPQVSMAKAYFANYEGDMYAYEENGTKGICIVDASGTVLVKVPMKK